jgi:hypothetical protein
MLSHVVTVELLNTSLPFAGAFLRPPPNMKILHRLVSRGIATSVVSPCDAGLGGSDVYPMVSPSFEPQLGLLLTIVVTIVRKDSSTGTVGIQRVSSPKGVI